MKREREHTFQVTGHGIKRRNVPIRKRFKRMFKTALKGKRIKKHHSFGSTENSTYAFAGNFAEVVFLPCLSNKLQLKELHDYDRQIYLFGPCGYYTCKT